MIFDFEREENAADSGFKSSKDLKDAA